MWEIVGGGCMKGLGGEEWVGVEGVVVLRYVFV